MIEVAPNVSLCVEEFGNPNNPLSIHIEGHMAQSVSLATSYCHMLADKGLFVVRFDNRDMGKSSRTPWDYDMRDMAHDVDALIHHYNNGPALITGRSMGGCIAQLCALEYPADVCGLGLFFTFAKEAEPLKTRLPKVPAPFSDEDTFVSWQIRSIPAIAGSRYPWEGDTLEKLSHLQWRRGVDWDAYMRQRRAIGATPGWAKRLEHVDLPTAIFHGDEDKVVPLTEGKKLGRLIPHSTLHIIEGMGHQQPATLSQFFADLTYQLLHE